MLEVKDLSKIYRSQTKNGADTHALDGVSLRFPEKGMVFLLGKSGSGKSTLLNVCGGLDAPTSGEIIVKGRSSRDFSQSDFDSYRNTFVGFIFQEYNILNEFTVEDNIALALELQGKPKDKKVIADLLEQVDLEGFAKRKPNTLSGGQKQRIAIARALVKSPEIIMADEPTGALDSATGKQVFDTLKKLSQDKLVIIVSHDREFAEIYADRIIELKDGKILSDVSKELETQQSLSDNLNVVGDVLCVKSGSDLGENDFELIKKFLKDSGDKNVIIASNEKDVSNFKKINKITDDGRKEIFADTDESKQEKKVYSPGESKFIRSKLPAKHAARIGISGLKTKPIRLFFTIILCVISFVLFGILSTLSFYDSKSMFKQTMIDSEDNYATFTKIYKASVSYYTNGQLEHSYETIGYAKFSDNDLKDFEGTFGKGGFGAIDSVYITVPVRKATSNYWKPNFTRVAYFPDGSFARNGMLGTYPTKNDEIAISKYMADLLYECRTTDQNGAEISFSSANDVLGKTIVLEGTPYKITAIFDSGKIDRKYDVIKDTSVERDYSLEYYFENELSSGLHLMLAVSQEQMQNMSKRYNSGMYYGADAPYSMMGDIFTGEQKDYSNRVYYTGFSSLNDSNVIAIGDGTKNTNDIIVDANIFFNMLNESFNETTQQSYEKRDLLDNERYALENELWSYSDNAGRVDALNEELAQLNVIKENLISQMESLENDLSNYPMGSPEHEDISMRLNKLIDERNDNQQQIDYVENDLRAAMEAAEMAGEIQAKLDKLYPEIEAINEEINQIETTRNKCMAIASGRLGIQHEDKYEEKELSEQEILDLIEELLESSVVKKFIESRPTVSFRISSNEGMPLTEPGKFNITGIYTQTSRDLGMGTIYLNNTVVDEYWDLQKSSSYYSETSSTYKDAEDAIYNVVYVPFDKSHAQAEYLWDVYSAEDYSADGSKITLTGTKVESLRMIDDMVKSLSKVFFYVGLVLAVFAILLFSNFISVSISQKRREIGILRAVGARSVDVFKIFFSESLCIAAICSLISITACAILCPILNTSLAESLGASIFVFGILSILVIIAIAVLTAAIATFLPVWSAAKKKPVDSIRSL
jgi:ABC-type lipoprotein export system ATPase subunit